MDGPIQKGDEREIAIDLCTEMKLYGWGKGRRGLNHLANTRKKKDRDQTGEKGGANCNTRDGGTYDFGEKQRNALVKRARRGKEGRKKSMSSQAQAQRKRVGST